MSGPVPRCMVKVAFGAYRVGSIIEPGAMLRNDLLRRGWIEIIDTNGAHEIAAVATVEVPPVAEKKRRGRPPKNKEAD